MATLHRIVLAIASSLNNGTSSPAPQGGNRALSNEPDALTERQEQPSAKTPHIPNRIGKGIGKFWIPILLATATALSTIPIEQAQAWWTQDEDGNVRSGPTPPAPVPVQPAAVPVPVVVVAKPVLKKGAILAGKWLIAVLAEYGVHTALDKVFQNNKDQEANAIVHGARWLTNEYVHKAESPPGIAQRTYHNYTTMADTGDENERGSAVGWDGAFNRSMTQSEVWDMMKRRKGTIIEEMWWATDPTYRQRIGSLQVVGYTLTGVGVKGRADTFAAEKAKKLRELRQSHGLPNLVWDRLAIRDTYKWKVGSFGMFSDFDDPAPILQELGKSNAIDSDANYYEAKATWKYRELLSNGEWGKWKDAEKTFSGDRDNGGDGIKSWEDHHFDFDFCDDNQEITDPEIYRGIKRFISKRPVYEWKEQVSYIYRGGTRQWDTTVSTNWVRVAWEPCVAQKYHDEN